MVIDSSVFLAILNAEPDADRYAAAIAADPVRLMSVVSWVELNFVVLTRKKEPGQRDAERLASQSALERVAVDVAQAAAAIEAFRRFGKGRHPAGLNLGDCFAYALAYTTGEPLLFRGNDFSRTDIAAVL